MLGGNPMVALITSDALKKMTTDSNKNLNTC